MQRVIGSACLENAKLLKNKEGMDSVSKLNFEQGKKIQKKLCIAALTIQRLAFVDCGIWPFVEVLF